MEGRLDDEYKQFEASNQEYTKRSLKFQENFVQTAETFQNAKAYYDVGFMHTSLTELRTDLQRIEKLENSVISQINDVNSKVDEIFLGLCTCYPVQWLHQGVSSKHTK
jgi:hypothetical protein